MSGPKISMFAQQYSTPVVPFKRIPSLSLLVFVHLKVVLQHFRRIIEYFDGVSGIEDWWPIDSFTMTLLPNPDQTTFQSIDCTRRFYLLISLAAQLKFTQNHYAMTQTFIFQVAMIWQHSDVLPSWLCYLQSSKTKICKHYTWTIFFSFYISLYRVEMER